MGVSAATPQQQAGRERNTCSLVDRLGHLGLKEKIEKNLVLAQSWQE